MNGGSIGPGAFVAVFGPSGAGKDSVIGHARRHLADGQRVHFARRVVTRPCDPAAEDHDTLDDAAFAQAEAAGAFALSWRSHGLCYGVPVCVDETVRAGGVVVVNVSRGIVQAIRDRYANVIPVLVTVSPDVLTSRLAGRGRETADEIALRLSRNADYARLDVACHVIDNSGPLADAGDALLRILGNAQAA